MTDRELTFRHLSGFRFLFGKSFRSGLGIGSIQEIPGFRSREPGASGRRSVPVEASDYHFPVEPEHGSSGPSDENFGEKKPGSPQAFFYFCFFNTMA